MLLLWVYIWCESCQYGLPHPGLCAYTPVLTAQRPLHPPNPSPRCVSVRTVSGTADVDYEVLNILESKRHLQAHERGCTG